MQKLELNEFKELNLRGCVIADARQSEIFAEGFIAGSVSTPFNETFIDNLQDLIDSEARILLVADEADIAAVSKTITGSGISNVAGYLHGGFDTWKNAGGKTDMLITIDTEEFALDYQFDEFYLVDVRTKEEFEKEHVEDAEHIALIDVEQIIIDLETPDSYYVYGNSLAQAVTAGSLFKRNGFQRARVVMADYESIKASGIPLFSQKKKGNAPELN